MPENIIFVRRKGTKAARKLPPDFPAIPDEFVNRVCIITDENVVPPTMFINFNLTNPNFVSTPENNCP